MIDWQPFWLTLQLAFITTTLLLFIALPFSYWLSTTRFRLKFLLEAFINLPLVLPPTIVGFYFLIFFNPQNIVGSLLENVFDISLVFSFEGLIVVSLFVSFPFMNAALYPAFLHFPQELKDASFLFGHSQAETFFRVVLPNIKGALLSGIVISFAHVVGEFGVVLMVGGNIPTETRTLSIAIYNEVEANNFSLAHIYSFIVLTASYISLVLLYFANRKKLKIV